MLAGVGVGVSSSVIPYVTDQLAMARIKRSTYALLVSLLPATATVVGVIVLAQIPTLVEIAGVGLRSATFRRLSRLMGGALRGGLQSMSHPQPDGYLARMKELVALERRGDAVSLVMTNGIGRLGWMVFAS